MLGLGKKGRARRAARRDERRAFRMEKGAARRQSRSDNVDSRTSAKAAAYNAGIDPNAWIASTAGKALDFAGTLAPKDKSAGDGAPNYNQTLTGSNAANSAAAYAAALAAEGSPPGSSFKLSPVMLGGLAIGLYFLTKK